MKYEVIDGKDASVALLEKTVKMKLKPIDVEELAFFERTPEEGIGVGIATSQYCKILVDPEGEPQAVFGVFDHPAGYSVPWLLTTEEHVITADWLKKCKREIFVEMCHDREVFTNVCHKDNKQSITWLKWLGFIFQPYKGDYIRFLMNVENIQCAEAV